MWRVNKTSWCFWFHKWVCSPLCLAFSSYLAWLSLPPCPPLTLSPLYALSEVDQSLLLQRCAGHVIQLILLKTCALEAARKERLSAQQCFRFSNSARQSFIVSEKQGGLRDTWLEQHIRGFGAKVTISRLWVLLLRYLQVSLLFSPYVLLERMEALLLDGISMSKKLRENGYTHDNMIETLLC